MGLTIFGLTFNLYGLILGLAILAAYFAAGKYAKRIGIGKGITESMFWWVVAGGIIGARLYHVVDKWQEIYSLNPQSVLYVWNGGLGIWGAIGGGAAVASIWYLVSGKRRVGFLSLLDLIFFGLPLGQAIGRWGNFFNNEIVGKNGEPLFLYESLLDLILFGLLLWISKRKLKPGTIVGGYLVGYGLIRILLEPLRPESIIWKIGELPMASVFCTMAIISGILLISRRRV